MDMFINQLSNRPLYQRWGAEASILRTDHSETEMAVQEQVHSSWQRVYLLGAWVILL